MAAEQIPEWTLGWRLQRSLDFAGLSVQGMAEELGVSRTTVSGWLNDRHAPRRIYVRYWAERCRVPRDWLEHGELAQLPRVDSNHQPADLLTDLENAWREAAETADPVPPALSRAEMLALTKRIPIRRRPADAPSPDRVISR